MANVAPSSDSSIPVCRLFIDEPSAGVWNMAVDEALLHAAAREQRWALRFYSWREPTLSLGYFQSWADRKLHPPSMACECVRRNSGGGAILHDQELTYSLAVPAGERLALSAETLYRTVHASLVELLSAELHVTAQQFASRTEPATISGLHHSGGTDRAPTRSEEPFLCFQRRASGDVVVEGSKIAGSAQRRWHGAVLQHGSILLGRSAYAPELPGLEQFGTASLDWRRLARTWQSKLSKDLQVRLVEEELSDADRQLAEQIALDRYGQEHWTRKR